MLAELYVLQRNLRLQGLDVARVHRDFDSPGIKGRLNLLVKLDEKGKVRQVTSLPPGIEPGLWTLKSGNHSYFPAVRTDKTPLLQLGSDDSRWKQLEKLPTAELVVDLCHAARLAQPQLNYAASVSVKQAARMLAWPTMPGNEVQQRLHEFAVGFQAFAADSDHGAAQLLTGLEIAATVASDPAFLASLAAAVVGKSKKAKGHTPIGSNIEYGAQLLFDFWSEDEPAFSLYACPVGEVVLSALLAEEGAPPTGGNAIGPAQAGVCALQSEPARLLRAPFPGWSAKPVISKSLRPFDKFGAAPCNFRYRRADSEAFDIGEAIANAVVGALKTVTEDAMRGKTWRPLKNGARSANGMELSDVLIAYPSCTFGELQSESWPNVADVFGEPTASDDERAAHRKRFEDTAEPVCVAFNQAITREPDPSLQILLIRQVSPGQIQIAYSAQPTLAQFNNAIEMWQQSELNLPDALRVPLRSETAKQGFGLVKPRLIFPERISRVLGRQWTRNGIDSTAVPAPPVGMVLDLFLRRPGALPTIAAELLSIALSRTEPLLRGVGGALHRDQFQPTHAGSFSQWKAFLKGTVKGKGKPDVGYAAANTISLIGSLLYAMDSIASDYTRRSAFLVGNLLAMMDELHKQYCVVVRDGAIPPSLIGNSLLGRASDSPAQALAELCDRSRPYIGWAKTVSTPGKSASTENRIAVHTARKLLRVAQPLCEQLGADDALAQPMGDLDKAHLFLGYLSPVKTRDASEDGADDEPAVDSTNTTPNEEPTS